MRSAWRGARVTDSGVKGWIEVDVQGSSFGEVCVRNIDVSSDDGELVASRGISDFGRPAATV